MFCKDSIHDTFPRLLPLILLDARVSSTRSPGYMDPEATCRESTLTKYRALPLLESEPRGSSTACLLGFALVSGAAAVTQDAKWSGHSGTRSHYLTLPVKGKNLRTPHGHSHSIVPYRNCRVHSGDMAMSPPIPAFPPPLHSEDEGTEEPLAMSPGPW